MVPKITQGGGSFKGAFRYYLHDKGADTSIRVAWTQVENMLTQDPEKAWKVMAFTAQVQERLKEASGQSRAGRKLEKPVFAFSLAWHPEQSPTPEHMLATAREAIASMGLSEHEAVIVSHSDEPQKHVHVIVNRVHPITGMAGDIRNSKRKLSDFALQYEREDGKIYCQQREANHREREAGKPTRYADPHLKDAWARATTGKGFLADLQAKGYVLAQGRKRLVVIDPHGKAHNPTRLVKGIKAKDLHALLSDLDLSTLPDANAVQTKMQFREASQNQKTVAPVPQAQPVPQAKSRIDALKEKHTQDEGALRLQQARRLKSTKSRLVAFFNLRERKVALIQLQERVKTAPWWKRLLGLTRRDRKTLSDQAQQYRADVAKFREKVAQVEGQNHEALAALQNRQAEEQNGLSNHIVKLSLEFSKAVNQKHKTREGLSHDFDSALTETPSQRLRRPHAISNPGLEASRSRGL
jgi:hypothetical protein